MGGHPSRQLILVILYRRDDGYRVGLVALLGHLGEYFLQHPTLLLLRHLLCLLLLLGFLLALLLHLRGGHPLLSILGCSIPSWHVVSSHVGRRLKFSRYSYHSCRRRRRLQLFEKHSESERKGNWPFEKHSTYSEGFRKAFGECSRRMRCDITPNPPFELHSERIPEDY